MFPVPTDRDFEFHPRPIYGVISEPPLRSDGVKPVLDVQHVAHDYQRPRLMRIGSPASIFNGGQQELLFPY